MLNAIWAVMILLAVIYGAVTGHMSEVTNAALDSAGEAVSLCITMAGVVALWMGLMEIAGRAGLVEKLTRGIAPFLRFMFPGIPAGHPAGEYIAANIIANVLGLGWACTPAGLKAMEELAKLEAERGNPEYLGERKSERGFQNQPQRRRHMQAGQPESGGRMESWTGEGGTGLGKRGGRKAWRQEDPDRRRSENASGGRRASNEMCTFLILNISSLQLIPVNMIAYRSQYGSANPTAIIVPAIAATMVSTLVAIVYCKVKDRSGRGHAYGSYVGGDYISGNRSSKDKLGKAYTGESRTNRMGHTSGHREDGRREDGRAGLAVGGSLGISGRTFVSRQAQSYGSLPGERKSRGGKAV